MTSATWLDKSIAWIAPTWGAKRAQSRATTNALLAYDGAKSGRRTQGWTSPGGSSADVEVTQYLGTMRERARDLVRNNPHATKAVQVLVANKIGTGIMAQASASNARRVKRIEERWKRWVDSCDFTRRTDLYGIQALVERTRVESGEALVRFIRTPMDGSQDVPFRLEVLEPDFINDSINRTIGDNRYIKHGIEYEGARVVAYWLYESHPGDGLSYAPKREFNSVRVPASEIIHYYKTSRPGQTRGMTDFASVMLRLRALDDYDDAEVMRKKIAACLSAFVTTAAGLPGASLGPTALDADSNRVETFTPGMIPYLKPGESVVVADPKPSTDYKQFQNVQLHAIAAGLGMPYELLTGDLSEVNYTSHRGGLVQFRGIVEADQWQLVVPQLCAPISRRFTEEVARIDPQVDANTRWTYTPPKFGLLDPSKEIPAMIESIQSGIESYPNVVRGQGYDWEEKLDEIEMFQREVEKRGIKLTSVPSEKPEQAPPEVNEDAEAA